MENVGFVIALKSLADNYKYSDIFIEQKTKNFTYIDENGNEIVEEENITNDRIRVYDMLNELQLSTVKSMLYSLTLASNNQKSISNVGKLMELIDDPNYISFLKDTTQDAAPDSPMVVETNGDGEGSTGSPAQQERSRKRKLGTAPSKPKHTTPSFSIEPYIVINRYDKKD